MPAKPSFEPDSIFTSMVDEMVAFSEYDEELAAGLRWIDAEAQRTGKNFYEAVFHLLHRYDTEKKAKEWMQTRN